MRGARCTLLLPTDNRWAAPGMAGHEHATVAHVHEALGQLEIDRLAGQVGADVVELAAEADLARAPHAAGHGSRVGLGHLRHRRRGLLRRRRSPCGQREARRGRGHAEALVRALCIVARDPGVELGLGLLERGEGPPREELGAQGAVEPLDLAGGRRAPGRREQVAHVVLAADAVEEHLPASRPEAPGEHLAVVQYAPMDQESAQKRGAVHAHLWFAPGGLATTKEARP
jgi:hypothetical protein